MSLKNDAARYQKRQISENFFNSFRMDLTKYFCFGNILFFIYLTQIKESE